MGKKVIDKTLACKRVRAQRIIQRFSMEYSGHNSTVMCKCLVPTSIFYLKYTINQFCSIYVIVCLFKVLQ